MLKDFIDIKYFNRIGCEAQCYKDKMLNFESLKNLKAKDQNTGNELQLKTLINNFR